MRLTIDASVFIARHIESEIHHTSSVEFFNKLAQAQMKSFCPGIVITEVVASIARITGDSTMIAFAQNHVESVPGINMIGLSNLRCRDAATIAANCRLRGADALYVCIAKEFGTTLITWDQEMLTRASNAVTTMTPADWLAQLPTT